MRNPVLAAIPMALYGMVACSTDTGPTNPGNPVAIDWSSCINDLDAPSWFAVQDGTGAWTKVNQTNGVFSFTVHSDKMAIATYANGLLSIDYATPAEVKALAPSCNSARRTVNGTVTGYATTDIVNIQADLGGATVSGTATAPASFTLTDVTPSPFDVLAVRSSQTVTGSTFTDTPTSVFIRRAQNTTPLASIDLNSASEAGAPLSQTVTVTNAASGENLLAVASLNTATTAIDMGSYSTTLGTVTGNVTAPFYGLSSTRLITGEAQTLDVVSTATVSSTTSDSRSVTLSYTAAADKSVTFGPTLGTVTVTGSARPGATYGIQAGYDQTFELDLEQGTGTSSRNISVVMTRGYLGTAATQATLAVPDLSGVSGFLSTWLMLPGSTATWTFFAAGATIDVFKRNTQNYSAGSRTSRFTP